MKSSDEVQQIVLRHLTNASTSDRSVYNALIKDLRLKFDDARWVNDILISMDYNHAGLLNLQLEQDAQNSLTGVIVSGSNNFLSPDGEEAARNLY